jgi:hypothetical protein
LVVRSASRAEESRLDMTSASPPTEHPPCVRCQYDLTGLPPTAVCPECGLSVGRSLTAYDKLWDCPPGWVRRLSFGVAIFAVAAAVTPALFATSRDLAYQYLWTRLYQRYNSFTTIWFDAVPTFVLTAGLLGQLLCVLLVCSRQPGVPRARRPRVVAIRALTLAGIVACLLDLDAQPFAFVSGTRADMLQWGAGVLRCVSAVSPALVFFHLKMLCGRMGRPKLAEYAGIVGVVWSVLILTFCVYDLDRLSYRYDVLFKYEWWYLPLVALSSTVMVFLIGLVRGEMGWVWAGMAWGAALGFAALWRQVDYTRALWKYVAVVGVPAGVGIVFYGWGMFLLVRMAVKFRSAAKVAERAWLADDHAV